MLLNLNNLILRVCGIILWKSPDNFIYTATQYIIGLELDYYKDELEPLYKALKPLYDE